MNTYKGIIKGNTIKHKAKKVLEEQIKLMEEAPNVGKLLYTTREELYER